MPGRIPEILTSHKDRNTIRMKFFHEIISFDENHGGKWTELKGY